MDAVRYDGVIPRYRDEEPMVELASSATAALGVQRLHGATALRYLDQRVLPHQPMVLTGLMNDRAAMWKWTPGFFRAHYPHAFNILNGRTISLAEQVDRMAISTEREPAPYPYRFDLPAAFPDLMKDLGPPLSFGRSDRTFHRLVPRFLMSGTVKHELFFGGRGASYPQLHYDLLGMHTQITQIFGEKEFVLFSPAQTPLLYPDEKNPRASRIPNVFAPDLVQFPKFREARPLRILLRQGETLFMPAGWWHTTLMYGPSITYGRAVLNASNWRTMLRENLVNWKRKYPLAAWPTYLFGEVLGGTLGMLDGARKRPKEST